MNPHSPSKKRELGAYYTPSALSQVLADWAIQHSSENILEPSFGGCGFFESCIERLSKLGSSKPKNQIYGVDIDKHAFDILASKFGGVVELEKRFILKDFIAVKPADFSVSKFDAILGNPPYVSMHNMTKKQRDSCDSILRNSNYAGSTMGRNASLWAFFLLHSLNFLKENGRVAWVLPISVLHADYAQNLIKIHKKYFRKIKVIKITERLFKNEGAKEATVIFLAEEFSSAQVQKCDMYVGSAKDTEEVKEAINNNGSLVSEIKSYKLNLIPPSSKLSYQALVQSPVVCSLGSYADVKIGMVTGANKYFIINKSTAERFNLPDNVLEPVVSRFNYLQGVVHNKKRQKDIVDKNNPSFLVRPSKEQMSDPNSAVLKYLSQISEKEISKNRTFQKRPDWFSPGWGIDGIGADCFLSYMIHRGPRMVVNSGKEFNCTNSIHKVIFHGKISHKKKKAICISMFSSLTQFSAEIEGRAYSSGVLKIEPSAGKRIKLIFSDRVIDELNGLQIEIENQLKQENFQAITGLVDNVLIKNHLITKSQCQELQVGICALRRDRYKGTRNYDE